MFYQIFLRKRVRVRVCVCMYVCLHVYLFSSTGKASPD